MGCQRAIVSQILDQGADYVITVKANQGKLYEQVEALFKQALKKDWQGGVHTQYKGKEAGHGRKETRFYRSLTHLVEPFAPAEKWPRLNSLAMAEFMRVEKDGTTSLERRYFITRGEFNGEGNCPHYSRALGSRELLALGTRCPI